jgi:V/A-type H+-transporting ATPase subunit K
MENRKKYFKRKVLYSQIILIMIIAIFFLGNMTSAFAQEKEQQAGEISTQKANVMAFGLVAAAIAFGFGAIGAGIAIANIGAAAMGAIGERPEIAGQALLFIALADSLVVFGFITALLILGKI